MLNRESHPGHFICSLPLWMYDLVVSELKCKKQSPKYARMRTTKCHITSYRLWMPQWLRQGDCGSASFQEAELEAPFLNSSEAAMLQRPGGTYREGNWTPSPAFETGLISQSPFLSKKRPQVLPNTPHHFLTRIPRLQTPSWKLPSSWALRLCPLSGHVPISCHQNTSSILSVMLNSTQ